MPVQLPKLRAEVGEAKSPYRSLRLEEPLDEEVGCVGRGRPMGVF